MRTRWSTLLVAVSCSTLAHAEPSATDKAAAEVLYDEGKAMMAEGKLEAACQKLAESQRLDAGVGTLLYLAECHERRGKTASAWATWREASSLAASSGQSQREKIARERAQKLESRLTRLKVEVPGASLVEGLIITRGGEPVPRTLWGSALPVDPGELLVVARAPGRVEWSLSLNAAEAGTLVVKIPTLAPEPVVPPGPRPPTSAAPLTDAAPPTSVAPHATSAPPPPPTARPPEPSPNRRAASVALLGVGALGVVAGSYFGIKTFSTWSEARSRCQGEVCGEGANSLSKDAATDGKISTVSFAIGLLGAGAGAWLWFTTPSDEGSGRTVAIRPQLAPHLAGLSIGGGF